MEESLDIESWSFTIIHSRGLGPLRPEKAWRPIITVGFDQQHHEIVLGSDGQNPNLKRPFSLRHVDTKSLVDIAVWYKSQTKKKTRKRSHVASARLSLDDLLKKQGPDSKCEIQLNCPSTAKRNQPTRGKQEIGACLYVKLCPPASYASTSASTLIDDEGESFSDSLSLSSADSETPTSPPTPTTTEFTQSEISDLPEVQKLRRRRVRGYCLDSDGDGEEEYSIDDDDEFRIIEIKEKAMLNSEEEAGIHLVPYVSKGSGSWWAASLLPSQAIDEASVMTTMSAAESTISCVTSYAELREACLDSDFEKIRDGLKFEWCFVGGVHVALAGLAGTVFGIQSGTIFNVSGTVAKNAVAVTGISSGFGLSVTAWLLLRHGGSNAARFQRTALDVYGSYVFFSITSRLPAFCLLVSALSLLLFMITVAYATWPIATLVMSFIAGLLCGLQYIAWVLHSMGTTTLRGMRGFRNGVGRMARWAASAAYSNEVVNDAGIFPEAAATPPVRPPRNPSRTATVP